MSIYCSRSHIVLALTRSASHSHTVLRVHSQSVHQHQTLDDIAETPSKQVSLGDGTGGCHACWRLQSIPDWYRVFTTIRPTCASSAVTAVRNACRKELAHSCLYQDSWPPVTWSCLSTLAPASALDCTWQDAQHASAELTEWKDSWPFSPLLPPAVGSTHHMLPEEAAVVYQLHLSSAQKKASKRAHNRLHKERFP